jgi:hypothetical protein
VVSPATCFGLGAPLVITGDAQRAGHGLPSALAVLHQVILALAKRSVNALTLALGVEARRMVPAADPAERAPHPDHVLDMLAKMPLQRP